MPVEFSIVTQGTAQVYFRLTKVADHVADPKPAIEEIYIDVLRWIRDNFDTEGAGEGFQKWEEVTPIWRQYKQRRGLKLQILQATGGMRSAMTTYRHPDVTTRIHTDKLVITPKKIEHRVHQTGTKGRRVVVSKGPRGGRRYGFASGIPARPFVRFSERQRNEVAVKMLNYFMEKTGKGPVVLP